MSNARRSALVVCATMGLMLASCTSVSQVSWQEADVVAAAAAAETAQPASILSEPVAAMPLPEVSTKTSRSLASSDIESVNNGGWRMGAVYLSGGRAKEIQAELKIDPVLSAWGYQFQFERGRSGSTVGLVDIVPMVLGMDESMFIPTINVLVGLRMPNNLEFGLGPHFSPRAPALQEYFNDELHVEGLGLAAAIGWAYQTPGGVNMSFNLSAMWSGDLQAYGLTFGWNMPE